jgi:hypothetical protein
MKRKEKRKNRTMMMMVVTHGGKCAQECVVKHNFFKVLFTK